MWHLLWREDGSVVYNCCWSRQRSLSQIRVPRDPWPHFYCLRFETPEPGGPGPRIYIPRNRVARLYPQALGSLFGVSYDSQGYGGVLEIAVEGDWEEIAINELGGAKKTSCVSGSGSETAINPLQGDDLRKLRILVRVHRWTVVCRVAIALYCQ
jgi:hypothetical protein